MDKIHYSVFKDLFKIFGINPYDFRVLSGDKVCGYFPDLPHREPKISVDRLAHILWEEGE